MKDFGEFKKITTEDCVRAICKLLYFKGKSGDSLNPQNWKRRSKSGSVVIVRTFENVVTGEVYIVSETKGEIFKITEAPKAVTKVSHNITVKDVDDWTDEFEEDPIVDGPINVTEADQEEFMKSLPKKFIEKGDMFDGWDLGSLHYVYGSEDELNQLWVDFINSKGYKNGYKEMLDDVK